MYVLSAVHSGRFRRQAACISCPPAAPIAAAAPNAYRRSFKAGLLAPELPLVLCTVLYGRGLSDAWIVEVPLQLAGYGALWMKEMHISIPATLPYSNTPHIAASQPGDVSPPKAQ